MSAVAALAVASPAAVVAVNELSEAVQPPTQKREFVQAAMVTDLPNELMSALSQGLSQFGINLPPMPTSLLTGDSSTSTALTSPGLTSPGLTSPGLTSPGLTSPGLTSPGLTSPGLTSPSTATPGLTAPSLASPELTTPGLTTPGLDASAALPSTDLGSVDASLTNPALTNPALTSPTGDVSGLTTPGLTPGLTTPGLDPTGALPAPGEVPISAPIGLDTAAGTYPILGDPSLATMPATTSTGSGGIIGELSSMANQLGAGQAIDLLKGMVMPAIMSAVKPPAGAPAVAPVADAAAAAAAPAVDAATAAIPGAGAQPPAEPVTHRHRRSHPLASAVPLWVAPSAIFVGSRTVSKH